MKTRVADLEFELLINSARIDARVKEIGAEINADYAGRTPVLVGVLNGGFLFTADLIKEIEIPVEVAFTKLASYFGGTKTTHKVRDDFDLAVGITGRDIILVEDIVDTGKTLSEFLPQLQHQQPASMKIVALLHKPEATVYPIKIDYLGFSIPNKFVVGYGLDYDGIGRNMKEIYKLVE